MKPSCVWLYALSNSVYLSFIPIILVRRQFTLLFQNRTEDDILLKEELEQLQKTYRNRLAVYYYLSNPGTEDFGAYYNANVY